MENAGLDVMGYDQKWREYTMRLTPKDFHANQQLLAEIVAKAYQYSNEE
jgi:hypothetical protein